MTIDAGDLLARAEAGMIAAFRAAGVDTPDLDARLLLQARLGLDRAGLRREAEAGRVLTAPEAEALARDVARRLARESVAVIVGEKEFWSLPLRVSRETLVPRPDTETVVEAALTALRGRSAPRIADLGTGTGAILLALLAERPDAFGLGVDIGAAALRLARENARRLAVANRARFIRADFAAAFGPAYFDLIVSNPPYIATAEIAALAPEVRQEPMLALDGGADGLSAYRAIAAEAPRALAPGGVLILEIGSAQAESVAEVFATAGMALTAPPLRDLAGNPRVLVLRPK